mmetsp:Transcript_32806/g.38483  ORF Transcript_32806/g.38483 Transcript_32806/m.38483 type:complete len:97 (+) Transcript_32806:372-662(+)
MEQQYHKIPPMGHTLYEDYRNAFIEKYKYVDNRFNNEIIEEYHDALKYNLPFEEVDNITNEIYRIALTSLIKNDIIQMAKYMKESYEVYIMPWEKM